MDKATLNRHVGQRLKQARKEVRWRQHETAQVLGVTRVQVANIEAGHSTVNVWQLVTLAAAYGRSVRDFCTPDPTPEQADMLDELATAIGA